jgi:hypothetical protein
MDAGMKLFDDRICHLTFSHTDCADVWKLYFPQMRAHFSVGMAHFVAVNQPHPELPETVKPLIYEEGRHVPVRRAGLPEAGEVL